MKMKREDKFVAIGLLVALIAIIAVLAAMLSSCAFPKQYHSRISGDPVSMSIREPLTGKSYEMPMIACSKVADKCAESHLAKYPAHIVWHVVSFGRGNCKPGHEQAIAYSLSGEEIPLEAEGNDVSRGPCQVVRGWVDLCWKHGEIPHYDPTCPYIQGVRHVPIDEVPFF